MKNKLILLFVLLLVAIQFIRPEKNVSANNSFAINTTYPVPDSVQQLLEVACNDCHSNKTVYPWYSNIQPIAWWLNKHVVDGKKDLNFSTFSQLPIAVQNHKLEEIIEMVEEKEMPLPSYTYLGLHKEANITDDQRNVLINWSKEQMASLKSKYPPDSLVLKRKK